MGRWTLKRWIGWILVLIIFLFFMAGISISLGAVRIPLGETWSIMLNHFLYLNFSPTWTENDAAIILKIRLPRALAAIMVGAALSLSGAVLQALLRNPLADPFVLGISSGAALGAVLAILLGCGASLLGNYAIPGVAFLGALMTIFLVYFISRVAGRVATQTMLLGGVIVNSFFSAIIMFLISVTSNEKLHGVTFWLMGNLEFLSFQIFKPVFFYLLLGSLFIFYLAKDLNLLSLGEETAAELGVEVERLKKISFLLTSLITGAVVAVSGLIGFVGLIIPHLVRLLWGPDHRFLLPAAAILGGLFLVATDTVARTIMAPNEIPVGVITALSGAPFFIYLLRKKGHVVYH